jgi:hypothetical protein
MMTEEINYGFPFYNTATISSFYGFPLIRRDCRMGENRILISANLPLLKVTRVVEESLMAFQFLRKYFKDYNFIETV